MIIIDILLIALAALAFVALAFGAMHVLDWLHGNLR
jgi:hypothetical protein